MNDLALRLLWRLTAALVALALLAVGVGILAHALDATGPIALLGGGGELAVRLDLTALALRTRWLWAGAGLLLALLGLAFAWLASARSTAARERSARVTLSGASRNGLYGSGAVTVGMESLHALVAHAAEQDPAVREADPVLRLKKGGWQLACRLSVVPDASIPELTARVKAALTAALERHTGLPVVRTDLDVQVFSLDARARVH
ncbi:hypothetical protein [Rubrivirga sp. IMCC45206]|uniref:hypothetical protein n=1 Tax=Rubrivirga sp. IMCC45206 TaxID=3391614 RepID=UPI00398FE552